MKTKTIFRTILVGGFAIAVANCARFASSNYFGSGESSLSSTQTKLPPVGLMSSDQMLKAMISVTGTEGLGELTDPADAAIDQTYTDRNGSLPSVQTLDQATGPTLISATNLASAVCAKAVDRDRATSEAQRDQRIFFREFDFSQGISAQSSDAVTMGFARLARNAWRRDTTADENEAIVTFAQEFSAGVNASDSAQTRMLAIGVCTAVLASVDALTY